MTGSTANGPGNHGATARTARPVEDVIHNPVTGERLRFLERAADTDGQRLRYELAVAPGRRVSSAGISDRSWEGYRHPNAEKTVTVLRGSVRIRLSLGDRYDLPWIVGSGRVMRTLDEFREIDDRLGAPAARLVEGETLVVPPNVPHLLWNDTGDPVHLLVELRPAGRFEFFLETMYGLSRDGRTNRRGRPNYRQMAVIQRDYREDVRFPDTAVLSRAVDFLARRAERDGYRSWYPAYSTRYADAPGPDPPWTD